MDKLARKALNVATSLVKRGCAEELAELLNNELIELVTVNTKTDIPCNLVRKFRDHRPNDASDDSEDDDETACLSKNELYTTKSNLCSCVSYAKKKELSRSRFKQNSKFAARHNGTLLELGAAYGQPDVVETLLRLGANPYGIHDGTTALLQALLHWSHTHLLQDRNACFRYRKVVLLLLENIDSKKYSVLWDQCPIIGNNHRMKFHPINYACSLDFSTGLEMLLRNGFRTPDGTDSALSRVLGQYSTFCKCSTHILTHQAIECIDLLGQYGYTFRVGLKTDAQLSYYLNNVFYHTIVKHPNPKSLSHLIESGANPPSALMKLLIS